ncbi:MAG: hypothetical protein WC364_15365 [Eubacteriales bacterium]
MAPNTLQKLAIDQELLDTVRLIRSGFGQLQQLDGANDFYHMPLLTLSSGFERFLKVILCLRHLEKTGDFPKPNEIPSGRQGHDLELLLKKVREECFLSQYIDSIPIAKTDLAYLESDELLPFFKVLGRFGQAARYHHLDVVLGRTPATDSPDREWESLETALLISRPRLLKELEEDPNSDRVFKEITAEVVARLERLARALARLFTIGKIGTEAMRYLPYVGGFLHLRDEDLGKTKYSPFGPTV